MREILFRGKRIDNGEWVEGFLVKKADPLLGIMSSFILRQEFDNSCINGMPTILKSEISWYKVIPETVGQYTRLTDKHGKKIFEGDIIKQIFSLNGGERAVMSIIEYGISYAYSNVCGVCQRFRDGSGISMLSVAHEGGIVYCEVIGNIHDNPELLKGENNDKA